MVATKQGVEPKGGPDGMVNGASIPKPDAISVSPRDDSTGDKTGGTVSTVSTPPKSPSPVPRVGSNEAGYSSGASTPTGSVDGDRRFSAGNLKGGYSSNNNLNRSNHSRNNMVQSSSVLGLDDMISQRKEEGDFKSNIVHIEVPFGKPIEDVYEGVHNGPVLGSGISGLVRLVTHKATGVKYAVKCLDLGLIDTEEGLQQLREEIFIMCQLDHPNIVRLEEVYESESEIYLVQELCLGGELFDRLDEQPDYHYTEAQCARLVKQMLCSVRYIHSKGIIHRDLKLENFLFSDDSPDSELKMIDFGLSKHFKFGEVQHEAVGTPYTVAPEVIRGSYDERCDVWAIGVITYLLLSGDPPFGGCGGPEPLMTVRANILKGSFAFDPPEIWSNVSSDARRFITSLLVTDPNNRPTAQGAQKSKWLKKMANKDRTEGDNQLNPGVVKALVNFKEYSDMRKLLCEVLSFTLLPDQIQELRKEFEKMDTEGSGEISLSALKEVLMGTASSGSLGALTEEEVEDIFNAMRVRKTETTIHWHEFIAAGLSQCKVDDRNLRLAFDRLDSDHKGYITFDNVMDLMGNDAAQSEDSMRRMWGDSMRACNCNHAIITYEDFLLLMKGQTKEVGDTHLEPHEASHEHLLSQPCDMPLSTLPEVMSQGHTTDDNSFASRESSDKVPIPLQNTASLNSSDSKRHSLGSGSFIPAIPSVTTPQSPKPTIHPISHSPPSTPMSAMSEHLCPSLADDESEGPLMMDDEEMDEMISAAADRTAVLSLEASSLIVSSVPVHRNLTPPQSPARGATDYVTPVSLRGTFSPDFLSNNVSGGQLPLLPLGDGLQSALIRRRSRSVDDQDRMSSTSVDDDADRELHFNADARRAMLLPEHNHENGLCDIIKDESKTPLAINRQLYRAHRQMRLAVLEASKRFEEEQTRRTLESLKAQKEAEGARKIQTAGLSMRHGFQKEISRDALRQIMEEKQREQRQAVEKATKRGGRGRRKKTVSDMAGMLSSPAPETLLMDSKARPGEPGIKDRGPLAARPTMEKAMSSRGFSTPPTTVTAPPPPNVPLPQILPTEKTVETRQPTIRKATTPGVFRKTFDPFGIGDSGHGTGGWVPKTQPYSSARASTNPKDLLETSAHSSESDLAHIMEVESPESPNLEALYLKKNGINLPPPPPL